ncbi:MAG: hypothetical protein WDM90_03595 [Ferruginibacter sp.]
MGIAYRIYGGMSFYQRKEVKILLRIYVWSLILVTKKH